MTDGAHFAALHRTPLSPAPPAQTTGRAVSPASNATVRTVIVTTHRGRPPAVSRQGATSSPAAGGRRATGFLETLVPAVAVLALAVLVLGRAGPVRAAPPLPGAGTARAGDVGPWDTKALVRHDGVGVFFSPPEAVPPGGVTFQVYRHDKADGRRFVPLGRPATCLGGGVIVTDDPWDPQETGQTGWAVDPTYTYLVYFDPTVRAYEEYYYLVWASTDRDGAGRPIGDPNLFLNGYAVAPAFPPTQTRHGNYTEYTNACTACHGLHSAKAQKLLKGPSVTDLCGTCHDGTGSKYDEVRGRVRRSDSWSASAFAAAGPFGDRLKEGAGVVVTSVHNVMRAADPASEAVGDNVAPASARVWQAPGSGFLADADAVQRDADGGGVPLGDAANYVTDNWGSYLVCSSCHEPHNRGKNYRLLRPVLNDRRDIVVRGVSEVDLDVPADPSLDRGNWGNGWGARRVMYTRYLAGGGSSLSYYDARVEDPAWEPEAADTEDLDGDGDVAESRAQARCDALGGTLFAGDASSPSGYRCRASRPLGGITSFCTACHRGFMWSEASQARDSYAYPAGGSGGGSGSGGGGSGGGGPYLSGLDRSLVSLSGPGPLGLVGGDGGLVPAASLEEVLGQHKHPISVPAAQAYREGRLVDGVLGADGDVCWEGARLADGTPDPRCAGVSQGRVVDPVVPLEGQAGDPVLSGEPYAENLVVCLTCHVAHGSGSERLEVAYRNGALNGTAPAGGGGSGGGSGGSGGGGSGAGAAGAVRDAMTGYVWNRFADGDADGSGLGFAEREGHPRSPGRDLDGDGTVACTAVNAAYPASLPQTECPTEGAYGVLGDEWPRPDLYVPGDAPYWTQFGVSSALARFNPFASVCYRCHSVTRSG